MDTKEAPASAPPNAVTDDPEPKPTTAPPRPEESRESSPRFQSYIPQQDQDLRKASRQRKHVTLFLAEAYSFTNEQGEMVVFVNWVDKFSIKVTPVGKSHKEEIWVNKAAIAAARIPLD